MADSLPAMLSWLRTPALAGSGIIAALGSLLYFKQKYAMHSNIWEVDQAEANHIAQRNHIPQQHTSRCTNKRALTFTLRHGEL